MRKQQFNVRLFLDGRYIDPSEYPGIQIRCRAVDRIVNRIYDLNHAKDRTAGRGSVRSLDAPFSGKSGRDVPEG